MNQLNCVVMITLAAALLASPPAHAAERARKAAATDQRSLPGPKAGPAANRPDPREVPVRVVGPEDGLRLTLTGVDGKARDCVAPCTLRLAPGELSLELPGDQKPLIVTIDQPSFIKISPPSQTKLIGGVALAITGVAVLTVAIIGGRNGNIGLLPAALLGGLGGGVAGLGGTLIGDRNGSAEVEPWPTGKP